MRHFLKFPTIYIVIKIILRDSNNEIKIINVDLFQILMKIKFSEKTKKQKQIEL